MCDEFFTKLYGLSGATGMLPARDIHNPIVTGKYPCLGEESTITESFRVRRQQYFGGSRTRNIACSLNPEASGFLNHACVAIQNDSKSCVIYGTDSTRVAHACRCMDACQSCMGACQSCMDACQSCTTCTIIMRRPRCYCIYMQPKSNGTKKKNPLQLK